jgi:hypothetical protein
MRKLTLAFAILAMAGSVLSACSKTEMQPQGASVPENAVWRTPNGYVIPYAERENWKTYLAENLEVSDGEKIDAKRWKSNACTTETITCGLECIEASRHDDADCTKSSACAPCMNCGCTPTTPR